MNLLQPWIKVLKTAKSESKAKLIAKKLMEKGYGIVATLPPQGNFNVYRIGIFDESKISIFDELNKTSNMDYEECKKCGKQEVENKFFKCVSCGFHECRECGSRRLYNDQIPIIHKCGKDNFEFLANIGKCVNCGEPMGFKSAPQKLRAQMMGKVQISSMTMMTKGLMGCFYSEKIFIEKEIALISYSTKNLLEKLKQQHSNPIEWLKTYKSIKGNFLKLDWSTSYVLDVLDNFLGMTEKGGVIATKHISKKLKILEPEFRIKSPLHAQIYNTITNNISKSQYDGFLTEVFKFITEGDIPYYSLREKKAIARLRTLSTQIQDSSLFDKYTPLIEDLILIDSIITVLDQPDLKCEIFTS